MTSSTHPKGEFQLESKVMSKPLRPAAQTQGDKL